MDINRSADSNWGAAKRFRLILREQGTTRDMGGNNEMSLAVGIVDNILMTALDTGTSDIHLQPERDQLAIRYRQDGVLHDNGQLPPEQASNVIARLKLAAGMRIDENREPQDGRIDMEYNGRRLSARASCVPSLNGEKFVMRLLDPQAMKVDLEKLGMPEDVLVKWNRAIGAPYGLILVTGPTGSGKTSTLYASLNKLDSKTRNIVTVEDPIEYQLNGIAQVQVNRKAGLTFANALRAFLRQDPDIIMVGEMRDLETAEIAIEASLTGHLVLSTLHTNDAPSATLRMIDMGVEPYLISATVVGILAQRLARKLCMNCKEPYEVPAIDLKRFGLQSEDPDRMVQLFRAVGCEECRNTGYRGRTGIHELMVMNSEIAEMVVRRAPLNDIKDAAKANGMKELREDGLHKVLTGVTDPQEVMRVVFTAGF